MIQSFCCKILCISLLLSVIDGVTFGKPIDNQRICSNPSLFTISNIFTGFFEKSNSEEFKQWEANINEKIKKEQYGEALVYSKEMAEAASAAKSEYWLKVSYYYCGLCAKYTKDYKSSLKYFLQIIDDVRNPFDHEKGRLVNLYRHTADVYKKMNDIKAAINYYQKSLKLKDKVKDKKTLVPAYVNLGSIYSSQNKFADARECYINGLTLLEGNIDFMASVIYNNLGNDEYSKGDYSKAIEYYISSIQISEKINDLDRLALTYNNIGSIYTKELSDPLKAIEYYKKSLEIEKKKENKEGIAIELNNIGNALILQSNFKEAEKTFEEALKIFTGIENAEGIAKSYEFLGSLYNTTGKYDRAIEAFTKCTNIRKKNNDEIKLADVYYQLGTIYFFRKAYNISLQYYFKSLELAKLKSNKSLESQVYLGIHETYASLGKFEQAYQYLQDYSNLKDTLLNATISKQVIDIQEKYEKNKMEQKVAVQNLEIKNKSLQRNGILAFLVLAIIVFISILNFIFQKRKNERLLYQRNTLIKDQEIKNLVQQSEIKSMMSISEGQENERKRISRELHDRVGSMLSLIKLNLSSYEEEDNKVIKENLVLLDNTYQEVRNISHNLHSGLLTQFGLKAALNDLKTTVESNSTIHVNLVIHEKNLTLPKEIEVAVFKMIQELVTNALKYSEAKNLDIQINCFEDEDISISVEDDGKGFDTSLLSTNEGIGLKNVKYRAESIGGSLEISSSPGKGSCFMLQIPTIINKNLVL
jgi:two-component system, NarL family, sensor kinase